jgi:uncharacterized protein YndB with AHSA1/START domain
MAIAVTIETVIARSPGAVFDELVAIDRWPSWLIATGIVAVARRSVQPPVAGEPVTIDQRAAGRASTVEATITALERPTRFAISGRDADGVRTELDAALSPTTEGGTSLRWSVRIDLPFRYRIFESMASPQVQRAAALDIEAFRRRLQSVATD